MKEKTVSAVVPVYNEEKTVGKVVSTLLNSRLVFEVICVDDGSTDGSLEILKGFGRKIKLLSFTKNRGKGSAVAAGIKEAKGDLLLFCDSDLINFSVEHIKEMLTPVLSGEAVAVFAVPAHSKTGSYGRNEVFLAGERVYPRDRLSPYLSRLSRTKGAGGSEVFLNTLFRRREIRIVSLPGLIKPSKEKKWSSSGALRQYLLSVIGILSEAGRIEIHSLADLKQLENLVQVDTFENLVKKIKSVRNLKLRSVLEKYLLRYVSRYLKKIRT